MFWIESKFLIFMFMKQAGLTVRSISTGLPQSGKNIWKMKFFPGQGKVREICGWPGKFRKDLESR